MTIFYINKWRQWKLWWLFCDNVDDDDRRGGVAWTWAGVRQAVMADGEGRREVDIIIVVVITISHNHPHDHCHRFNIGAGNSLDPEIDDLQSGQSESFLSHLVVHMFEINCCARTKKWFDQSLPKINLIIILKAWAHTRFNFTKLQKTLLWLIACLSFHICTKLCLIFCLTLDFHLCFDRVLPDPESCFGELHLI